MRALLDTHTLIWWMEDARRLSRLASEIIENPDNQILISAAVGWEMAIKAGLAKLRPRSLVDHLLDIIKKESFSELPITIEAGVRAGLLSHYHRDPFDRMLAAQALTLDIPILSADEVFNRYGAKRLW